MTLPLLDALHHSASDRVAWLALADCLEEQGENDRAELTRLFVLTREQKPGRKRQQMEASVRKMLVAGISPCVPGFTNSVGMTLSLIPPGRFRMGAAMEDDGTDDEWPHEVELTRPYYLGIHAVTQAQYTEVIGSNPSYFRPRRKGGHKVRDHDADLLPVEQVTWDDASEFCRRLSEKPAEKAAGRVYRLPTEAEWEFAARGAALQSTSFHFGDGWTIDPAFVNYDGNYPTRGGPTGLYREHPLPVGSFAPDVLGLYDTAGNIWEWCADWYHVSYYHDSPRRDPIGPEQGSSRAMRGGAWGSFGSSCRAANRDHSNPEEKRHIIGFRVLCRRS